MSDYLDVWYESNKEMIEKENMANEYRTRLSNELTTDDMIAIMFAGFIKKQSDCTVIKIAERYLRD